MKLRTFLLHCSVVAILLSGVFLCATHQRAPATGKTDDALDLVKQGQKLNSEGKQDEALALYDRALQLSPNLYQADLAAGIAWGLQGMYQHARERLTKAEQETINKVWRLHVGEDVPEERYYLCANRDLDARGTTVAHSSSMPTAPLDLCAQEVQPTSRAVH